MANARIMGKSWADDATLSATSEALAVENLQDTDVAKVWRSTADSDQNVDIDLGIFRTPTWLYLENINYDGVMTITVKLSSDNFASFSYTASLDIWSKHLNYWAAQHFFSGASACRYVRLVFSGSSHPDGYFEAGRLKLGEYFDGPNSRNLAVGPNLRYLERGTLLETRGGTFRSETKSPRAQLDVTWQWIHNTDAWTIEANSFADLLETIGHRDDVLISVFPAEGTDREQRFTILGRLIDNSGIQGNQLITTSGGVVLYSSLSLSILGNAGEVLDPDPFFEQVAWYIHGSPLVSLPTTARSGASAYVPDGSSVLVNYADSTPIEVNGNAVWCQPAATNKYTNYNAAPTDTTGVTKTGDASSVLSVVDDSAELAAAGLDTVCSGNVFKLDNSAGAAAAFLGFTTTVGNTNPHTVSAYVRSEGGDTARIVVAGTGASGASGTILGGANYQRLSITFTPGNANNVMRVQVPALQTAYAILQQMEETSYITPVIVVAGSSAGVSATEPYFVWPSGLTSNFAGSFIWRPARASQGTIWLLGNYTDANTAFGILHDGTNIIFRNRVSGSNNDATKALAYAADTDYEIHFRHDAINGLDIAVDEVKGTTDSTTTAVTAATNAYLGQDGNDASHMQGSIRQIKIWQTRQGISDVAWLAL